MKFSNKAARDKGTQTSESQLQLMTELNDKKVLNEDVTDLKKVKHKTLCLVKRKRKIIPTNSHYEMPLPFKERPKLPNNKICKSHHLNGLESGLKKRSKHTTETM